MNRREFIAGLGGAAAMYPLAVRSQPTRIRRIGMLSGFAASGGFELASIPNDMGSACAIGLGARPKHTN